MKRPFLLGILFAGCLLSQVDRASAAVLFTDDFSGATAGAWNQYNGWTGSGFPTLRNIGGKDTNMVGAFTGTASDAAAIQHGFATEYGRSDAAYRLTFDIRARIYRSFRVMLTDASMDQVGLQLGFNSSTIYQIGGATKSSAGTVTMFNDGGYYSMTSDPDGYSSATYYQVHIDVNGTSQTLAIGGLDLSPGKVRVIYNAQGEEMATFTTVFDLPESFSGVSGITVERVAVTTSSSDLDNFQLESIPVPEPSTAHGVALGGVAILLMAWMRRRTRASGLQ